MINNDSHRPARLGIMHLLLWTAGCGAMLAAQRWLALEGRGEVTPSLPEWSAQIAAAMIEGAALAGLLTSLIERIRRRVFPVQPGEWLLVACGAGVALDVAARLVIRLAVPPYAFWRTAAIAFLPATAVSVGIYARAFQKCLGHVEWAPLFSTTAIAQACSVVIVLLGLLGEGAVYIVPVASIVGLMSIGYVIYVYISAVSYDLLHAAARGPLHWAGVVVLPLHTAVYFLALAMWLR